MGDCGQQKHTQHAPSTKTDCDYVNGLIKKKKKKKTHTNANISLKMVNPRDIVGNTKEEDD